jgi:D-xylonolactonase
MSNIPLETIANDNNRCGESPFWDAEQQRLLWVDNVTGWIFEYRPAGGGPRVLARDLPVSGLALNQDNRLVLAGGKGIVLWKETGELQPVLTIHDGQGLNFNDIIADAKGNLYGGTFYWGPDGREQFGKLYLIRPDGTAAVLDEGIELSNGLGFSPDGRTLYFTDTLARKIYAYDVESVSGVLKRRRLFVAVPTDEGLPDGLTVDAEGFVWSAQWYGSQVVRYDPDGKVERRLNLPVQQVSSVMFGGPDLTDLYITSAGEAWPSEYAPPSFNPAGAMGGSLYRARTEVQGCREHRTQFN